MNMVLFRKGMVFTVIVLFVGAGIVPSIISDGEPSFKVTKDNDGNIGSCAFDTATFYPTDDSHVTESHPDQTPGSGHLLNTRGLTNWRAYSLIRFDISSLSPRVNINSAKLHLYYYQNWDGNPSGHTLNIHKIIDGWNEGSLSWNNQPSHHNSASGFSIVPSSPGIWMEWDVTSDVQEFIDGSIINYGWKIIDIETNSNDLIYFYSKEYGSFIPYLEIGIDE